VSGFRTDRTERKTQKVELFLLGERKGGKKGRKASDGRERSTTACYKRVQILQKRKKKKREEKLDA